MKGYFALILAVIFFSTSNAYPKIRVARQAARIPTPARVPLPPLAPEVKPIDEKKGKAIETDSELDYDNDNSISDAGEGFEVEPSLDHAMEEKMGLPSNATSIRNHISDSFRCEGRGYGFYADVDNDCQIFHVCLPVLFQDGTEQTLKWSFICPGETLFNQETFTCTRSEDAVACADAPQFYRLNDNFGQATTQRDVEVATEEAAIFGEPEAVEVEAADEDDTVEVSAIEAKRPLIQQYLRRQPPIKYGHRH